MKCAVVTAIGPGQEKDYSRCRQTVEEAWARGHGPFDGLELLALADREGIRGRAALRNDGIALAQQAGCEWVFFVDADNLVNSFAFDRMALYHQQYDAVWGNYCEVPYGGTAFALRQGQVSKTERIRDILCFDPALTVAMGHFVRTACAAQVPFATDMPCGEDFKHILGLWERFRCAKVEEIFVIEQRGHASTNPRVANSRQWNQEAQRLIREAAARLPLVADVALDGKTARFAVANPFDIIQACQCRGEFFEQAELLNLKARVGTGKAILELGANVGNHLVFYGQHMQAARIYPFEPNPESIALLDRNIALNGLEGVVDRRGIGFGVGREHGRFSVNLPQENNLGAARLVQGGEIPVVPLDAVMAGVKIDFIKMDVEGMEFEVLEGAKELIAANRPLMYVEVWNDRIPAFVEWMNANDYTPLDVVKYVNAINVLLGPK